MRIRPPILAVLVLSLAAFQAVQHASAKGPDPEERIEYYLTDHLGGVEAVLDERGNVVERRDYLPFGEERVNEGTDEEPRGFTGKELDDESGLYYYGARYYDPVIGRFTSVDPLVLDEAGKPLGSVLAKPQNLNAYSYVINNPLRYVDPTGMFTEDGTIEKGDTLKKITKTINERFNTSLKMNEIAKANQISDPNKIKAGGKIKLPGQDFFLKFNNEFLQAIDSVYKIAFENLKWAGISGNKNSAPIPEGLWVADPKNTEKYSENNPINNLAGVMGAMMNKKIGLWPGGQIAWGDFRTELSNKSTGANRSGYYIHGGLFPGSAGCIDLTSQNNSFHDWFLSIGKPMDIQVEYPKGSW